MEGHVGDEDKPKSPSRKSSTLESMNAVLPVDGAVKVLEVTAREIVDRISNCQAGDVDSQHQHPVTGSTSSTPKRGSNARTLSETSISSTRSGRLNSTTEENVSNIAATSTTAPPPPPVLQSNNSTSSLHSQVSPGAAEHIKPISPIQSKRVQKQLTVLQHWIKESHDKKGTKDGEIAHEAVYFRDNLYYLSSIESFVRDLPSTSQETLSRRFSSGLLTWLKNLFHFKEGLQTGIEYNEVLPHWEKDDGHTVLTKWQLHLHFPNVLYGGYDTFAQEDRYPVIYCSDEDVGIRVTSSLGLSKECFSLIETTDNNWINTFEELILFDKKRKITPIIFLINIGKTSKNLEKGVQLCDVHNIPVHIFGRNTFTYFVKRPELEQIGNSFTIDLNPWVPSPRIPYLTIYKLPAKSDQTRLKLCGLASPTKNVMTLTPWFCTEVFGLVNTKSHVEEICEMGQFLLTLLKKYLFLSIIPNWSTLTDGQVIVSSLIFRFCPKVNKKETDQANGQLLHEEPISVQYVNVLNSWLYHILERDFKDQVHVEFVDVNGSWHILFDVLKTQQFSAQEEPGIEKMFEHHMHVLYSTVAKKSEFARLVAETNELEDVDYDTSWAGLGAVRYIPKFYRDEANRRDSIPARIPPPVPANEDAGLHRKSNINHLNAQIVDKLKAIDNAFSLGVYGEGDWCVQFGMVTEETEVNELLRLVIATGEDIEESSEFFQQMSELVKKGIEKATEELKRESEEAMWEEGILRRVPVVGTFVNWFSPPVRESGIRGRALNLAQGKVESTENIYKYHMQVESPSSNTSAEATNILNRLSMSK